MIIPSANIIVFQLHQFDFIRISRAYIVYTYIRILFSDTHINIYKNYNHVMSASYRNKIYKIEIHVFF